jgi:hypothetical protein
MLIEFLNILRTNLAENFGSLFMYGKQFNGCDKAPSAQASAQNTLEFSLENCKIMLVVVFLADEVAHRPF